MNTEELARWIVSRPQANAGGLLELSRAYLELLEDWERLRENVEDAERYASELEDEIQTRDEEAG